MTETFTWKAEVSGTSGSGEFKASSAQFGDGYAQEASIGLNPERQRWQVSVSGFAPQLQPVVDFVRAHAGVAPFFWTPPLGVQGYYKIKKWQLSPNGGNHWTLGIELEQTYGADGIITPPPVGDLLMTDEDGIAWTDEDDVLLEDEA